MRLWLIVLLLSFAVPLAGCPDDDDDDATADDDDSVTDDDDDTGDDDDTADDDDATGDDDDSTPADLDGDGSPADEDCDDADPANFPDNSEVCDGQDNDCDDTTWADAGDEADLDGDGSLSCEDCDDQDGANAPDRPELCDGQDNDCDAGTVFLGEDTDGDGDTAVTCLDCDDNAPTRFPGNPEICDELDNDCDASTVFAGETTDIDNDGTVACFDCDDADADAFPNNTEACDGVDNDCDPVSFAVGESTDADSDGAPTCLDCNDNAPTIFPGNPEICDDGDNDCIPSTWAVDEDVDADADGAPLCLDCDDGDIANFPGNGEVCDGADNDCDGATFASGEDTDGDSDGTVTCLDCDDGDGANFPGNPELCDGQDNDCDAGTTATGEDSDADNDGALTCLDCDDGDPSNFPGNPEVCDDADNDCDAGTFATGEDTDADGDSVIACLDCDDNDIANFPGNVEICDGGDNDCDADTVFTGGFGDWTLTDSSVSGGPSFAPLTLAAPTSLSLDDDEVSGALPIGFTFGFAGQSFTELYVSANGWVSFEPSGEGFAQVPLGEDDDVNLVIAAWMTDLDPGQGGTIQIATEGTAPDRVFVVEWVAIPYFGAAASEQVTLQLQLFETSNVIEIHVTAADIAPAPIDGVTVGIEGDPPLARVVFDQDPSATLTATSLRFTPNEEADQDGDGELTCATDCDDAEPDNFAANPEVCDGADNDCSGAPDADPDGEVDADDDTWLSCDECDDEDDANYPGNTEICDAQDNDCDGTTFATGEDTDGDNDSSVTCLDCDDGDSFNFPGNPELCDGADNDCSGAPGIETAWDTGQLPTTQAAPDRLRGGLFEALRPARLTEVRGFLDGTLGDTVDWFVFEGTDPNDLGGFTLLSATSTTLATGSGTFHSSDPMDIPLVPGRWYVLAFQWSTSATYRYRSTGSYPATAGPLEHQLGVWINGAGTPTGALLNSTVSAYQMGFIAEEDEIDGDNDNTLYCADCDDGDDTAFPGNTEICDGVDNDCDGAPGQDEGDGDSDGALACDDCDDGDGANFPGNAELCDGQDNDCDGAANFEDAGDWVREDAPFGPLTLGLPTTLTLADDATSVALPLGFDFRFAGTTHSQAYVRSNGWLDFSGQVPQSFYAAHRMGADDGLNEFIAFWWADLDPSTGGAITYGTEGAAPNRVFVVDFDDVPFFNRGDASVATDERVTVQLQLHETTDLIEVHITQADAQPVTLRDWSMPTVGVEGVPPNADVVIDRERAATATGIAVRWTPNEETDDDGDGLSFCEGDCGDQNPLVGPGQPEICDGLDNDCDGIASFTDETVHDDTDSIPACADCDDHDRLTYPGAPEICDGLDNDCSGTADDYPTLTVTSAPEVPVGPGIETVTDSITITDTGVVGDLDLRIDLAHAALQDVQIQLISPAGTVVTVVSGAGGTDDDYADTVWDDEGADLASGAAPYAGRFVPRTPLAAFDGEPIAGVWTLVVDDLASGDGGFLHSWALELYPQDYGLTAACGPASCDEMLDVDIYAPDGPYFLDTQGSGSTEEYGCDMSTDGGGWTSVYDFDRQDDGDSLAFFASSWDTYSNTMTLFEEQAAFIRWQDFNFSRDALSGVAIVTVPNTGEVLYDLRFAGTSMEGSGVWFGVGVTSGTDGLWCNDNSASDGSYTASQLAAIPYTCGVYTASPAVDGLFQTTASGEVDSVVLYALMSDANGGDDARLYRYSVWVR